MSTQTGLMSLLVQNHFGVLTKITGLFGRRGYNIKALSVGESENPALSRITIITQGDETKLKQIYYQVSKLEEVVAVGLLPYTQTVVSELALVKVRECPPNEIGELIKLNDRCFIVRVVGTPKEIDKAAETLSAFGIIEMSRTGPTALNNTSVMLNKIYKEEYLLNG